MIRVAHVLDRFSPLTETFVYDIVSALEGEGCQGTVVALERVEAAARPFPRVVELAPSRARRRAVGLLHAARARVGGPPGLRYLPLRGPLGRALRALRPDVIHAHFGPMGVLAAPIAAALDVPLVVSFYGFDVGSVPAADYADLWPRLARAVALCESMRRELIAFGCPPGRISVVHLAKRLEDWPYQPPTPPLQRFLSVGRLTPKKGHDVALEALAALGRERPELRLEVIGEGPERPRLEELVRRLGLEGRVTLRGALPAARIPAELRAAHGLVLASRTPADGDREGTPTAIIEAQLVGLPVVSTTHAGIPEVVPLQSHDLLAREGDAADLARAWGRLLELDAVELDARAVAAREWTSARHDVRREAARLREDYGQLRAERRAPGQDRLRPARTSRIGYLLEELAAALREAAARTVRPGDRVLDLGCGSRPYRELFAGLAGEYLGADLAANPEAEVLVDADGRVALPDASVDVVLSTQVLEHVSDPVVYLREARRLLRPGGRLLLTTHGVWRYHPDPLDLWRWTSAGLRHQVEAAGLRVDALRGLLGPQATATQLWQDASARFVPGRLHPLFHGACQLAMRLQDALTPPDERDRDAAVYLVEATLEAAP
ncbi:MAG: glycosyltransferase [Planctomycetota bacterium]